MFTAVKKLFTSEPFGLRKHLCRLEAYASGLARLRDSAKALPQPERIEVIYCKPLNLMAVGLRFCVK